MEKIKKNSGRYPMKIETESLDQWGNRVANVANLQFGEFFIEHDLTDKQTYLVLRADTDTGAGIVKFPIGVGIIKEVNTND